MISPLTHNEPISQGQLRFRLHGPDPAPGTCDDDLSGAVFASKLQTLIRALREADRAVNGGKVLHDYKIAKLQSSAPTVTLSERNAKPNLLGVGQSGVAGFQDCAEAINAGDFTEVARYGKCARHLATLAQGSHKTFSYGEIWTAPEKVFRIDEFLGERSQSAIEPDQSSGIDSKPSQKWFIGTVYGGFDGTVKEVDLRGSLPAIKLVLTAGGKQIDCIFRESEVETIRASLNHRVRLSGMAIYDGRSGLPRRIEKPSIELLEPYDDLARWAGVFSEFAPAAWENDDEW